MKLFAVIFFTLLALSHVMALPAGSLKDDAEVIALPKPRPGSDDPGFHDFKGVIDTGAGYPFLQPNPHTFSFNLGFFDSFEDIFRRLRARLWPVVAVPGVDSSVDSQGDSGEGGFSFSLNPTVPKNGNTTSTVKVVDGHKVEVNETVYGDRNSVFKVRIVNIRPLESGEEVEDTVKTSATDGKDEPVFPGNTVTSAPQNKINEFEDDSDEIRDLVKKPIENEIEADIDGRQYTTPQNSEDDETMLLTDSSEKYGAFVTDKSLQAVNVDVVQSEVDNSETVAEAEAETLEPVSHSLTHEGLTIVTNNEETETVNPDLHNRAAEQAADADDKDNQMTTTLPIPNVHKQREDAESSDDEDTDATRVEMNPTFNSEWETLAVDLAAANDAENDLNNGIDVYDTVPVDLSNDIAVNDIAAADPNFQPNPDAEFIDVGVEVNAAVDLMPKFEKLSLTPAIESTSYQQERMHEMK